MSLIHVNEICGDRQSGRSTLINNRVISSISRKPGLAIYLGSDLRMREVSIRTSGLDKDRSEIHVIVFSTPNGNGVELKDGRVTQITTEGLIRIMQDQTFELFVDNVDLFKTKDLLSILPLTNIRMLTYTGITGKEEARERFIKSCLVRNGIDYVFDRQHVDYK